MLSRLNANTGSQTAGAFDGLALSVPGTTRSGWERRIPGMLTIPTAGIDEVQWWP